MTLKIQLFFAATLLLASCAKPQHTYEDEVLAAYAERTEVNQLLIVTQTDSSDAHAAFYVRQEGIFELAEEGTAHIGKNGVGKTKEGDMKTPAGELRIGTAFGILPNPGTEIPYVEATESLYGCEDSTYYNQLIDTAIVHHPNVEGEHIIDYAPAYNYGLTTSFNEECVFGLGSNIYIHCKGKKPYTAGCVALDEEMMKHLLQQSDRNLVVFVR